MPEKPRLLAFFNHKGGVGKTTLTFNVALALARAGQPVLLIDADAQTNLTSLALDERSIEAAVAEGRTISDAFSPLVRATGDVRSVVPTSIREDVWLLPGNIRLSDYEDMCPQGWNEALASAASGITKTTAPYRLATRVAETVGAQFVFFDVGPNVGAMNRNILIGCDGFIVPLAPDLFSISALSSVGRSIDQWILQWNSLRIRWNENITSGVQPPLDFDLPPGSPAPLGYVTQQFATYKQRPTAAYSRWANQVPEAYRTEIRDRLSARGVRVPTGDDCLGEIRNLSSLVPMAQRSNKAIFELGGYEARGAHYTKASDTLALFQDIANEIADRLIEVSE